MNMPQPNTPAVQRPVEPEYIKEFFTYELDFASLASGTSDSGSFNIQADSDFVLQKLGYFADIAAAAQTDSTRVIPLVSLTITDTGSGRQLMSSATPIPSIFGTGQLPFILPTPRLFQARSNVAVTVQNFDAAATYNLKLSFIGYKRYRIG